MPGVASSIKSRAVKDVSPEPKAGFVDVAKGPFKGFDQSLQDLPTIASRSYSFTAFHLKMYILMHVSM